MPALTDEFIEDIVKDVTEDFATRRSDRKPLEAVWQLNMNFVMGNQYCHITGSGEIEDTDKHYFWQEREVYNHIAPILETRLAKLGRVRPKMSVRAASSDDKDLYTAKMSSAILSAAYQKHDLSSHISKATMWAEVTGSAFYKVTWDKCKGLKLAEEGGEEIFEGDVSISVCPPFEIFPDSLTSPTVEDCESIIHARAVSVSEIADIWGVDVDGGDIDVYALEEGGVIGGLGYSSQVGKVGKSIKRNHAIVIERYERPTKKYPDGRLIIVAADKLLHYGPLPFINAADGKRGLPFTRQISVEQAGSFFGTSVIERAIPVQRSYNAVKNRKHEFLNRIAMGVLTVEDGSVDTDNLEEEGLSPGKVLIYRQGSTPPHMMDAGKVPSDFAYEEQHLLSEFVYISGVSEIMRNSIAPSTVSSGVALQLLIEQDDTRLSITADNIKNAVKCTAEQIMRLFKQFVKTSRLSRVIGKDGEIEVFYFEASDISAEDIYFDTETELSDTPAQKRNMVFDMLQAGLLFKEDGKLDDRMRVKILDILGFGEVADSHDISRLHIKRSAIENQTMLDKAVEVSEIDEHTLHLNEHTKFMLSAEYEKEAEKTPVIKERFLEHIRTHKKEAANEKAISATAN